MRDGSAVTAESPRDPLMWLILVTPMNFLEIHEFRLSHPLPFAGRWRSAPKASVQTGPAFRAGFPDLLSKATGPRVRSDY